MKPDVGAVVLAAGQGARLGDSFPGLPKPMVPVHGTPIIGHLVSWLLRADIAPVVVVWGPLPSRSLGRDGTLIPRYFAQRHWRDRPVLLVEGSSNGTGPDAFAGLAALRNEHVLLTVADQLLD